MNQIPEEPGKVYYYNQKGKIIYIDASADIRRETFKTFRNPKAQRRENIVKHVNEISWEVCGNTLIAELEQLEEINKHQPSFNRWVQICRILVFLNLPTRLDTPS